MARPTIYLIAGCNGAGKTTFAREFLPKEVKCLRFLNADEIARGLSPFKPSAGRVQAGRILLGQIHEHIRRQQTFALETTLSGKTYLRFFREAKRDGYVIELHYLWLSNPAQAIARVRRRVQLGGHHVPPKDVRRRFKRSIDNLLNNYASLVDEWVIWDSRQSPPIPLAFSRTHDIESVRKMIDV